MSIQGIDTSKWNGNYDVNNVAKYKSFIIIKASEGVGYTDPQFSNMCGKLRSSNMVHGFYHFARPDLNNGPENEANWFMSVVGDIQENEILALDMDSAKYVPAGLDPVDWCYRFLKQIENRLNGYKGLLYINLNLNNTYNWARVVNNDNGLWLAYYDNKPEDRPITDWPFVAIKQFGATSVPGLGDSIDGNTFFGDVETLKKYGYHKPVVVPIPEPEPEPTLEPTTEPEPTPEPSTDPTTNDNPPDGATTPTPEIPPVKYNWLITFLSLTFKSLYDMIYKIFKTNK